MAAAALAAVATLPATGCLRKDYPPKSYVVAAVDLDGTKRIGRGAVLDGLATAASPKFLGIWDGVIFDYEVFEEPVLEADLARIQRHYRAHGYYETQVTAARVIRLDAHHVRVEIHVYEGEPVLVAEVQTPGAERLPADVAAAIRVDRLSVGDIFDEGEYERTKKGIVHALTDKGYAFAKVKARADVDTTHHLAVVVIEVDAGPRARYGPIRFVGLDRVPEGRVRDSLGLVEGAAYSRTEIDDARAALVNLGIFATIDIKEDTSKPDSGVVPITVEVKESPFRALRLGGGLRLDVYELSSHLTIGWEHRNFLGGMRKFSIDFRPGAVFYPTRIDNFEAPSSILLRSFIRAELRQPVFLEGRTAGFVAAEFNVYPVLYAGEPDPRENLLGYKEFKAQAGLERPFFGHRLYLTPSYNFQINAPFAYSGDDPLETAYVAYPQLKAVVDLRNDPIDTHSGILFSNTIQVAGLVFGGGASDVRVQPEIRAYVPVSTSVTLATRATLGLLFPFNYGGTLQPGAVFDVNDAAALRDEQLLLLRAFFSGGPTSNRGYPYHGVGPQGILGFLLPNTGAACTDVNNPDCLRALGGLTLWEASIEVRFAVMGSLGAAIFVDASDVSRETADIRLNYPHLSTGFGLRYATPIGPIRFDLGYRVPYAQKIGEKNLPETEGIQSTVFGAPMAISFALGEAY